MDIPSHCFLWRSSHSQHLQTFILMAITVAKKTSLLNWEGRTKWSTNHRLNHLTDQANLDKLSSNLNDNINSWHLNNTWSPSLQYIQSWFLFTPAWPNPLHNKRTSWSDKIAQYYKTYFLLFLLAVLLLNFCYVLFLLFTLIIIIFFLSFLIAS